MIKFGLIALLLAAPLAATSVSAQQTKRTYALCEQECKKRSVSPRQITGCINACLAGRF